MAQKIINLTLPVVIQEIEDIFDDCFYHPYQQAFAIPELRQKLIAYVLSRIRNRYVVIEEQATISNNLCSQEQRLHIEAVIQSGIHRVFQENADWVNHHIADN